MTEKTHTPGPWTFDDDGITASIFAGSTPRKIISVTWANDHQSANARLIAAAPDMLEALRRASSFILCNGYEAQDQLLLNEVCTAIAKAEGRS